MNHVSAENLLLLGGALALSLGAALLLMPLAITLGWRFGFLVRPRLFRRSHRKVSYLGGTALALGALISVIAINAGWRALLIFAFGTILLLTGYLDDRGRGSMAPSTRLLIIAAVSIVYIATQYDGALAKAAFEVFVLVSVTNALNMLDNMDGVAGSTSAGTSFGVAAVAMVSGSIEVAAVAAALCGASLAFLRYNYRRPKLYLGNGGSLFVGFTIAACAVGTKVPLGVGWELVAMVALVAVPATDMFVTMTSRFVHRRRLMVGGIDHASHRLVWQGLRVSHAARLHGFLALIGSISVGAALIVGPWVMVVAIGLFAIGGVYLLTVRVYTSSRVRPIRLAFAMGAGVVSTFVLLSIAPVLSAASSLHSFRSSFEDGVEAARRMDRVAAVNAFRSAEGFAEQAEKSLSSPMTLPARLLPVVGDNIRLARDLSDSAGFLGSAGLEGVEALSHFVDSSGRPRMGVVEGRILNAPWQEARGDFDRALSFARFGLERAGRTNGAILPPLSEARDEFVEKSGVAVASLQKATDMAELMPVLAGLDRPRTWFLAIQNPVELRATGGFVGAFGILRSEGGHVTLQRLDSNLSLPPLQQPVEGSAEFMARYDRFAARTMWQNVNMTPDFPLAARQMMSMWKSQSGVEVDGVIAIDASGLSRLLSLTGPVSVPELGEVKAETFVPLVLHDAYLRFPDKPERASFLLAAGREIWQNVLRGTFTDPSGFEPVVQAAGEKHLMIWGPEKDALFRRLGIAGSLNRTDGSDYLLVVGQNAAANKVDYFAERAITYKVDLADERIKGSVKVDVTNKTPQGGAPSYITRPYLPEDPPGLNRSYLSIYVPPGMDVSGARLGEGKTGVESHQELGFNVFSQYLEVLPGKSSSFQVDTRGILGQPGEYRLVVQRQATLHPDSFQLEVLLPPGKVMTEGSEGVRQVGRRVIWSGALTADREFVVRYDNDSALRRLMAAGRNMALDLLDH